MGKRKDTRLEAEGAEFLVLGNLLINKISAYKAYVNFPGYDLIATNAESNTSVRIQVKSRYQTNWDGFIIKNYDCDFVVLVTLNRGYPKKKSNRVDGIKEPDFYIMPISYVKEVRDPNNSWGKIVKSRLVNLDNYKDDWKSIEKHLLKSTRGMNY